MSDDVVPFGPYMVNLVKLSDRKDKYASRDKKQGIPTVTLSVSFWHRTPTRKKPVKGLTLTLYEVEKGRDPEPIGLFNLDLYPAKQEGGLLQVRNARWPKKGVDGGLRYQFEPAFKKGDHDRGKLLADFVLRLGGRSFYLMVPNPHDEGKTHELGFKLEGSDGTVEHMSPLLAARIPTRDWIHKMRALPNRFSDPKRMPPLPDRSSLRGMEAVVEPFVHLALGGASDVDLDGFRFDYFLRGTGKTRRAVVEDLHGKLKLSHAKGNDWYDTDIVKAYFVIHCFGGKGHVRRNLVDAKRSRGTAVHGFMNWGGGYASGFDLRRVKSGTVYGNATHAGNKMRNFTIEVETISAITYFPKRTKQGGSCLDLIKKHGYDEDKLVEGGFLAKKRKLSDELLCVGFKEPSGSVKKATGKKHHWQVFRWTKVALEALADLYVLASARAGHLLTVTCHIELDRNLGYGYIWPRAEKKKSKVSIDDMKSETDKKRLTYKIAHSADSMHGDPYGIDLRIFYDLITKRLQDLSGRELPMGRARYGIHPDRIIRPPLARNPTFAQTITNHDKDAHSFPHQSSPKAGKVDDTLAKKIDFWKDKKKGKKVWE